ncbi:glycoside hydrolase family protein, partial [Candidatus Erwinia dacicola]
MKAAKRCTVVAVVAIAVLLPQFKTLKISEGGLQLIADAEGCRTSPYQCSAGVWTNGIGHTAGVTPQSRVSERQAAVNLVYDVVRVERQLDICVPVEMPAPVYDALVS